MSPRGQRPTVIATAALAATDPAPAGQPAPEPICEADVQPQERYEDELILHLERDQFVAETSRPLPRVHLSRRAKAGLWALRCLALSLGAMVIYTFISQLS